MGWMEKLEKKIGKYSPKRIVVFIIGLYGIGFFLNIMNPNIYVAYLSLDISKILHGQVWRIVTWLMYPASGFLMFILSAYMYYWIGSILENTWGTFQFDLYYICGILLHVLVSLVVYLFTGVSYIVTPQFLNLSMFLAYAALFPDRMVLFFFIIPLKSKWLAFIDLIYFGIAILKGITNLPIFNNFFSFDLNNIAMSYYYISEGIAAISSLLVFAIFYYSGKTAFRGSIKDRRRKKEFDNNYHGNQNKRQSRNNVRYKDGNKKIIEGTFKPIKNSKPINEPRHKCEVCGRTDITNPELEFRYCSKCNGVHEYCMDHLYTHEHK